MTSFLDRFRSKPPEQHQQQEQLQPSDVLFRQTQSVYAVYFTPLNHQVQTAATGMFGKGCGEIIGTAFKVLPIVVVIFFLPQPASLVGFAISFAVKSLSPNAFENYPVLSKLCAQGMGFYSALKAIECSFFALDPVYLIAMAIHLAIAHACFAFVKHFEDQEKKAEAEFRSARQDTPQRRAAPVDDGDGKGAGAAPGSSSPRRVSMGDGDSAFGAVRVSTPMGTPGSRSPLDVAISSPAGSFSAV